MRMIRSHPVAWSVSESMNSSLVCSHPSLTSIDALAYYAMYLGRVETQCVPYAAECAFVLPTIQ